MRKWNKITAFMLTACMGATALAGCSNAQTDASGAPAASTAVSEETVSEAGTAQGETQTQFDTSEHVVLTMYCIGDEGGIYAEDHLKAINEMLTEKINAEIDPIMVSWGDYKTKLPMVWASGEAYDLSYTSNWTGYFTEAEKGAFMDITELFPTYAPLTYAELSEKDLLETTKFNGKLYMVPNDLPDYTSFIYNYREDLRKKYNCPEIVDKATLEAYMDAIRENEPGMTAFGNNGTESMKFHVFLNEMDWSRPLDNGNGIFCYDLKNPTKVFNVVETPEYEEYVREARDYYEKGYWSQSIMAETGTTKEAFQAGTTGIYLSNFSNGNGVYLDMLTNHPDWEIGNLSTDYNGGMVERVAAANNGMAIGAYSKNPERAMMFIELMYQDNEMYDLMMNGLEGITYEKDEATMTKKVPEGIDASTITLKNLGMGFGSQKFYLGSKNDSPTLTQMKEDYDKIAVFPELSGFSINQDTISADLAGLKAIVDEYKIPLEKGVMDPEEGLAQLKEKLKNANVDAVMEEINAQIAAYLAK